MAEHEADILPIIQETQAWRAWRKRYETHLEGQGEKPSQQAEGQLFPIPPDTYSSMREDLQTGVDTAAFADIGEELSAQAITAVLESYSPWATVAVMRFFRQAAESPPIT